MASPANSPYRMIPGVNEVLERADVTALLADHSRELVTGAVRALLAHLREQVGAGQMDEAGLRAAVQQLGQKVRVEVRAKLQPRLRRVINATGVLLQTNLGRAPLSEAAIEQIGEIARGYCNLEFDLEAGERSRRDVHAGELILEVLRAYGGVVPATSGQDDAKGPGVHGGLAAAVVNNCAAATFLALNTLGEGGEVIVSRGELVEIGGGFRIPEILAKSGAILREVGTTNKTRISDYAAVLGPNTKLILRVHRSNFRIEGFTEQPSLEELVTLGRRAGVPVFDDQGTGCLLDMAEFGLPGESSWARSVGSGVSLVAASGDKLLGGPQCGVLVGEQGIMERIHANPLFRALRVDKLTYAALQATLLAYLAGEAGEIPVVRMMRTSAEAIKVRCQALAEQMSASLRAEVVPTQSVIGGGTTPGATQPSFAVALRPEASSETAFAARLRRGELPVVGRVSDGSVLLDLRSVMPAEDEQLVKMVIAAAAEIAS